MLGMAVDVPLDMSVGQNDGILRFEKLQFPDIVAGEIDGI